MPNVAIPEEHLDDPIGYAIRNLRPELTGPLYDFSKAVYQNARLPLREFEAVRARIALINGCKVCQGFRSIRDVPPYLAGLGEDPAVGVHTHGPAPDEEFYLNIGEWRDSPIYTARERIAIEFAERFSQAPDALGYDEAFWTRAKQHFTEGELYEMTIVVGCFVATGRFVHVLGFDEASCAIGPAHAKAAAE
jgi:alkylhydroperoxidase family enzyme